ncbi:hypothetical protein KKA14_00130, partial [bacterium]|nr:hypothetical protein [bacterium]
KFYFEQISGLLNDELKQELNQTIESNTKRYASIDFTFSASSAPDSDESRMSLILDCFPTFVFCVANELAQKPSFGDIARKLLIAYIFGYVHRTKGHLCPIKIVLDSLDKNAGLKNLNTRLLRKSDDDSYTPKRVFKDFMLMASNQMVFEVSKNVGTLVMNLFCFEGISRIFLRYYFELLFYAESDIIATHIYTLFSKFLSFLRFREKKYWDNFGSEQKMRERLLEIVQQNKAGKGHPTLRKEVFEILLAHNPALHDGSSRQIFKYEKEDLKKAFMAFSTFSIIKLALYLESILICKGPIYTNYLLVQILRSNKEKFIQLKDYTATNSNLLMQDIYELITHLLTNGGTPNAPTNGSGLLESSDSARLRTAKQKLLINKDRKALTQYEITKYLERLLQKMYANSKKEGALTQYTIDKYLAYLAKLAADGLSKGNMDKKKVISFAKDMIPVLTDISSKDQLTDEDIKTHTATVKEKVEERVEEYKQEPPPSKNDDAEKIRVFLNSEIIPIGFENDAPKASVKDFFAFPLADQMGGPAEEDWFAFHKQYVKKAVEDSIMKASDMEKINELLPMFPKLRYTKYFNIFPGGEYDDPILMVVYGLWQNNAFNKMLIKEG